MSQASTWEDIERAGRELGFSGDMLNQLRDRLMVGSNPIAATPRELEIMRLIGAESPDRLVHDVRNLLNEISLLRVLADMTKEDNR